MIWKMIWKMISSFNTWDHKTQKIEDDGFTIPSNSMIMDELEYRNMLRKLNGEKNQYLTISCIENKCILIFQYIYF
jgi:hypothetical protein